MFRSIRTALQKRQVIISAQKSHQLVAQETITAYLKESFGDSAHTLHWSVVYNPEEKQVCIQASSKTLASELLLRAGEIGALLRREGISIRQLLIR